MLIICFKQKQSSGGDLSKRSSENFIKIHRKAPVLEMFNKIEMLLQFFSRKRWNHTFTMKVKLRFNGKTPLSRQNSTIIIKLYFNDKTPIWQKNSTSKKNPI